MQKATIKLYQEQRQDKQCSQCNLSTTDAAVRL
jgi:hypothetical protein